MPFLIRIIAQRVVLVILSTFTVLGLTPQTNLNQPEPPANNQPNITAEIEEIFSDVQIPLPKVNILNLPQADLSKPDAIQTPLPTIPKEPTKTSVIQIAKENLSNTPKEQVAISVEEIITDITQPEPDESVVASIENVLVNILCVRQIGNKIYLSTGSGVIISSNGVVLTNAHVAQHFLLKDSGYNCTLRRENIPLYGFNAEPIYISETWIQENYKQIANPSPTGTGKYDYALLRITSNTNPTLSLPNFPTLPIETASNFLDAGDTITIAGYPGKLTSSLEIAKGTELQTDRVRILEIFTLGNNTVDVVESGDTSVAQKGSSGGGAFKNNKLGGIIVSTNNGSSSGKFVVNILTLSYINREIKNETGKTLTNFTSGDLQKLSEDFATDSLHLKELLKLNL